MVKIGQKMANGQRLFQALSWHTVYQCEDMIHCPCSQYAVSHNLYSRTSIIPTPVCHFNVKGVQINEFACISELSDKIHYVFS